MYIIKPPLVCIYPYLNVRHFLKLLSLQYLLLQVFTNFDIQNFNTKLTDALC